MVLNIQVDPTGMDFPKSWKHFYTVALSFFMELMSPQSLFSFICIFFRSCLPPGRPGTWRQRLCSGLAASAGVYRAWNKTRVSWAPVQGPHIHRLFFPILNAASDGWLLAYLTKTGVVTFKSAVVKAPVQEESATLSDSLSYGWSLHYYQWQLHMIRSPFSSLQFFLRLNGNDRILMSRHLER